jgi:stress response protein SCP2
VGMIKYIVSVATELDGHAFSETFYLETTEKMTTDKIIDIVFYEAKKENELQIKHIKNNKVWGDIYGFTFAFRVSLLNLSAALHKLIKFVSGLLHPRVY